MLPTHGRYEYSNISKRLDYAWPGGHRLAVYVALNIEAFSFGSGKGAAIAPPDQAMDWTMDDQPIWIKTRKGRLLAMPYPVEVNSSTFSGAPSACG